MFAECLDDQLPSTLPHHQFVFTLPKALRVFPRYEPRLFAKLSRLILEGGFDSAGQFYHLPIHETARLSERLRRRAIGLFLKPGLITEHFAETLLC